MAIARNNRNRAWPTTERVPVRVPTVNGTMKSPVNIASVACESYEVVAVTIARLEDQAGIARENDLTVRCCELNVYLMCERS